jgi:hypothetical protein
MKHSHYKRDVSHLNTIDVYRIIDLFGVTCPVAQHVLKKSLAAGQRGHKDLRKDWQDIMDSAERRLQMLDEDYAAVAHLAVPDALTRAAPHAQTVPSPRKEDSESAAEDAEKLERWKSAPEWANWLAQDGLGESWSEQEPKWCCISNCWQRSGGREKEVNFFNGLAGKAPSKESRPCAN